MSVKSRAFLFLVYCVSATRFALSSDMCPVNYDGYNRWNMAFEYETQYILVQKTSRQEALRSGEKCEYAEE